MTVVTLLRESEDFVQTSDQEDQQRRQLESLTAMTVAWELSRFALAILIMEREKVE